MLNLAVLVISIPILIQQALPLSSSRRILTAYFPISRFRLAFRRRWQISPGHSHVGFPCFEGHSITRVGLYLGQLRLVADSYTVLRLEAVMWLCWMYLDKFGDLMRGIQSTRNSRYPWSEIREVRCCRSTTHGKALLTRDSLKPTISPGLKRCIARIGLRCMGIAQLASQSRSSGSQGGFVSLRPRDYVPSDDSSAQEVISVQDFISVVEHAWNITGNCKVVVYSKSLNLANLESMTKTQATVSSSISSTNLTSHSSRSSLNVVLPRSPYQTAHRSPLFPLSCDLS